MEFLDAKRSTAYYSQIASEAASESHTVVFDMVSGQKPPKSARTLLCAKLLAMHTNDGEGAVPTAFLEAVLTDCFGNLTSPINQWIGALNGTVCSVRLTHQEAEPLRHAKKLLKRYHTALGDRANAGFRVSAALSRARLLQSGFDSTDTPAVAYAAFVGVSMGSDGTFFADQQRERIDGSLGDRLQLEQFRRRAADASKLTETHAIRAAVGATVVGGRGGIVTGAISDLHEAIASQKEAEAAIRNVAALRQAVANWVDAEAAVELGTAQSNDMEHPLDVLHGNDLSLDAEIEARSKVAQGLRAAAERESNETHRHRLQEEAMELEALVRESAPRSRRYAAFGPAVVPVAAAAGTGPAAPAPAPAPAAAGAGTGPAFAPAPATAPAPAAYGNGLARYITADNWSSVYHGERDRLMGFMMAMVAVHRDSVPLAVWDRVRVACVGTIAPRWVSWFKALKRLEEPPDLINFSAAVGPYGQALQLLTRLRSEGRTMQLVRFQPGDGVAVAYAAMLADDVSHWADNAARLRREEQPTWLPNEDIAAITKQYNRSLRR